MPVDRVFAALAALSICAVLASPARGQGRPGDKGAETLKLTKAQIAQYEELSGLVDAVIAGKEPAPADLKVTFQHHFIRSAANVFVPYVLEIGGGKLSAFPVGMYVRAVSKTAAPTEGAARGPHAFTDLHFLANPGALTSTGQGAQIARALELPAGEFDLYIAISETPARNSKAPARRVVHTQSLSVPDLSGPLTTSSIVLATSLEDAPQQLTPRQQMEQPFTIAGQKIAPAFTSAFPRTSELLFLFLVYNEGATPAGKPDLDVSYTLLRGAEAKPFARLATMSFNAATLPAAFDLGAGHQVLVVQGVPLSNFAAGEYRLEISLTDKIAGQTISRTLPFTVTP